MKKLAIFFLLLSSARTLLAQKDRTEAYINTYKELAIAEMIRTGVPAAITLAQGVLESQSGESDLAKGSNNHFGIKCKPEWTGGRMYHDDDLKGECFRVYPTVEESYRDHSDFLKNRPYYTALFKLDPADYEAWAKGLKKAGYATNPKYPQQLLKVINDYNLQQYSKEALVRVKTGIQTAPAPVVLNTLPQSSGLKDIQATKNTIFPQGIFTINHSKVIYANGGTSLLSLASQYDVPLAKLLDFNDLPQMDILDSNRLIFLEKKLKKGASDFHIVSEGETLYEISQLEGIRFENLLEYNNLKADAIVSSGAKIYLKATNTLSAM